MTENRLLSILGGRRNKEGTPKSPRKSSKKTIGRQLAPHSPRFGDEESTCSFTSTPSFDSPRRTRRSDRECRSSDSSAYSADSSSELSEYLELVYAKQRIQAACDVAALQRGQSVLVGCDDDGNYKNSTSPAAA